jgi:hypothetical protein
MEANCIIFPSPNQYNLAAIKVPDLEFRKKSYSYLKIKKTINTSPTSPNIAVKV